MSKMNKLFYFIIAGCLLLIGCQYVEDANKVDFGYIEEPYKAKAIHIVYCEHMGYEIILINNTPQCLFNNTYCDAWEFYYKLCGKEHIKEIVLRKKYEYVYPEIEGCEKGLMPSEKKFLLDASRCING